MTQTDLFYRFGVALAIGFLIGLQREYAHGGPERQITAGERTLALMGLVGCLAALVADELNSPWTFVGILASVGVLIAASYFVSAWRGGVGLTTEVAALLTVLTGALCYWGYLGLAAAIAVATTVLLSLKTETDRFVRRITQEDIRATLKFAVITAIVLPVLPNQTYGLPPLDVLNPHKIWLMVVFISGINFFGYVLIQLVGPRQGIGLTGLLGGLASSTAVTLGFAERSQRERGLARPFALAIIVAWTVMFPRVLVEVAALNRDLLSVLWQPILASAAAGLAYCVYLYLVQRAELEGSVTLSNPFELGPVLKFGVLYAVILLLSKAAQTYLGETGIYISSVVSGLAGVDAITLSMAELSRAPGVVDPGTAGRAIVLATMSNTVAKGGLVLMSGSPALRKALLPGFALIISVGLSVTFLI
ncbi:MAG: MgtC/SapB family protein [Chloroflexi bacterium]|nr:MAG: MgtC/SapB family protein [Chloroflexota bacterium]